MNKGTLRFGFWSAVLCALVLLALSAAYAAAVILAPPRAWPGMAAYSSSFQEVEFLPPAIGLLFIPPFIALLASMYLLTSAEKKGWSLAALVFGAMFSLLSGAVYLVQLALVRPQLLQAGQLADLDMWVLANGHSVAWMVQLLGWGCLALATLFIAVVLDGGGLENGVRWLLLLNSALALAAILARILNVLPLLFEMLPLWPAALLLSTFLLSLRLRRAMKRLR